MRILHMGYGALHNGVVLMALIVMATNLSSLTATQKIACKELVLQEVVVAAMGQRVQSWEDPQQGSEEEGRSHHLPWNVET